MKKKYKVHYIPQNKAGWKKGEIIKNKVSAEEHAYKQVSRDTMGIGLFEAAKQDWLSGYKQCLEDRGSDAVNWNKFLKDTWNETVFANWKKEQDKFTESKQK